MNLWSPLNGQVWFNRYADASLVSASSCVCL